MLSFPSRGGPRVERAGCQSGSMSSFATESAISELRRPTSSIETGASEEAGWGLAGPGVKIGGAYACCGSGRSIQKLSHLSDTEAISEAKCLPEVSYPSKILDVKNGR